MTPHLSLCPSPRYLSSGSHNMINRARNTDSSLRLFFHFIYLLYRYLRPRKFLDVKVDPNPSLDSDFSTSRLL